MKRVGIITHFKFYNQGTMLQAYALQRKIELLNNEAEIINYKEIKSSSFFNKVKRRILNPTNTIKEIKKVFNAKRNSDKIQMSKNKYNEFYKMLNIGEKEYVDMNHLIKNPPIYDIYMVGSDQTWNPHLAINTDAYYLNFVPKLKTKVSYAPSIGVKEMTPEKEEIIKKELSTFKYISCREKKGCQLLEDILNRNVEEVLDPTFLIPVEEWNKVIKYKNISEKYMLCYFLIDNKDNIRNAEKIAKLLGLKTYYIYTYDSKISKNLNYLFDVGPSEFLGLIKNSEFVCTDSFHGSVFSIIFNKQFCSFTKNKDKGISDNNRIYELLDLFNLKNRYIAQEQIVDNLDIGDINYDEVNEILNERKMQSEEFLKKCLE